MHGSTHTQTTGVGAQFAYSRTECAKDVVHCAHLERLCLCAYVSLPTCLPLRTLADPSSS